MKEYSANDCCEVLASGENCPNNERRDRNESDLLLSGGNSVERSWKRQVDAATARVVARQGSFGAAAEGFDAKGDSTIQNYDITQGCKSSL